MANRLKLPMQQVISFSLCSMHDMKTALPVTSMIYPGLFETTKINLLWTNVSLWNSLTTSIWSVREFSSTYESVSSKLI